MPVWLAFGVSFVLVVLVGYVGGKIGQAIERAERERERRHYRR